MLVRYFAGDALVHDEGREISRADSRLQTGSALPVPLPLRV